MGEGRTAEVATGEGPGTGGCGRLGAGGRIDSYTAQSPWLVPAIGLVNLAVIQLESDAACMDWLVGKGIDIDHSNGFLPWGG